MADPRVHVAPIWAFTIGRRTQLSDVAGVDSVARQMIVAAVNNAGPTEVPAVLLVHGEGFISVGIRRLPGKVTWLS